MYQIMLKHKNIIMKPAKSPTQGQPNPRKIRFLKWHLGHFFQQQILFRGLGFCNVKETDYKKPNPTKFSLI